MLVFVLSVFQNSDLSAQEPGGVVLDVMAEPAVISPRLLSAAGMPGGSTSDSEEALDRAARLSHPSMGRTVMLAGSTSDSEEALDEASSLQKDQYSTEPPSPRPHDSPGEGTSRAHHRPVRARRSSARARPPTGTGSSAPDPPEHEGPYEISIISASVPEYDPNNFIPRESTV